MDDADSGIYQSRTESVVDSAEAVPRSAGGSDVSRVKDCSSGESGTDEISDISSLEYDEISSASSSYHLSDEDDYSTPSTANSGAQVPKKKLSISGSFLATSIAKDVTHIRPQHSPEMKITSKEGERNDKSDFISCQSSRKPPTAPSTKQPKSSSSNPKRILKLHLSASPLEISSESNDTPSPPVPVTESTCVSGYVSSRSTPLSEVAELSDSEASRLPIYVELRDPDKSQCSEWRQIFNKDDNVTICCQDFFLSGSRQQFWIPRRRARDTIHRKVWLADGDAVIIRLAQDDFGNDTGVKFAIYAPTMRVPLQVQDSVNAYLAFRAALRAVKRHNRHCLAGDEIMTVLSPSLCNSFGGMPPGRIAHQMKEAYDAMILHGGKLPAVNGLGSLATHHVEMTTNTGAWC